ncbi:MAG TPA: hypothetical protein PKC43_10910 [Phycisphaerales bacterium]|nr:hypothetical protein [Phycisphaerales bacterium]
MITLVQSYRGVSQREVAAALGRNVHAIVPDSGNPKLDLVVSLAELLDWPVEMVVASIQGTLSAAALRGGAQGTADAAPKLPAKERVHRAWELAESERWTELVDFSEPSRNDDLDGEMFAHLMQYRFIAMESDGRYLQGIEACRLGLRRTQRGSVANFRLRAAMAYGLMVVGLIHEAEGVSTSLCAEMACLDDADPEHCTRSMSRFTRGNALRLQAPSSLDVQGVALEAIRSLSDAARGFDHVALLNSDRRYAALARTARAAMSDLDVILGKAHPGELVAGVIASLDRAVELDAMDSSSAESVGWECVFACQAILRSGRQIDDAERALAILTNKLDQVAARLGHWALREQLFSIEHLQRVHMQARHGVAQPWSLDEEDVRTVMGTMGRFPEFRAEGWRILAAVLAEKGARSR